MAWPDEIPQTLTVESDGKTIPLRDHQLVKDSPNLEHFAKRAYDMHSEVGRRIPLNVKTDEEKAAWKKDHLPKLYSAGILEAPPSNPEGYDLKKPESLPEGLTWSDENAKALATTLHKWGIPKSAVPELMDLHTRALLGIGETLKTNYDNTMIELKKEHGDKFDERMETSKRLTAMILKSPEEVAFLERTGLADHPTFLNILMRLAPLAQSDSSFVADMNRGRAGGGEMTGDEVRTKWAAVASNAKDPKYDRYWAGDPAIQKEIDEDYKKAYGTGTVTI